MTQSEAFTEKERKGLLANPNLFWTGKSSVHIHIPSTEGEVGVQRTGLHCAPTKEISMETNYTIVERVKRTICPHCIKIKYSQFL